VQELVSGHGAQVLCLRSGCGPHDGGQAVAQREDSQGSRGQEPLKRSAMVV